MKTLWEENKQSLVESALQAYKNNVYDFNAGYNILRYAIKGVLKVDVDSNICLEHYRTEDAYKILRLSRDGNLSYNG